MASLKNLVKPLLPKAAIDAWRARAELRIDRQFARLTPAEVFSKVYEQKMWGTSDSSRYCSGTGSHDAATLAPYVIAVRAFLEGFQLPPNVVDLGCGDFNVGAQLRSACADYIGCDVVADLIRYNRQAFGHLDVSFIHIDITRDALPAGNVALVRQVLQHLNNEQIASVTSSLARYAWVVVTEQLPKQSGFVPNLDKPIGPGVRLRSKSGVVLTASPFNLRPLQETVLCSAQDEFGLLQTTAYQLHSE